MNILEPAGVARLLKETGKWELNSKTGEIFAKFQFRDFLEALAFVNKVGALAEELGHHPDITITYNRVVLSVITHDAGGLTEKDFSLANKVNQLL